MQIKLTNFDSIHEFYTFAVRLSHMRRNKLWLISTVKLK